MSLLRGGMSTLLFVAWLFFIVPGFLGLAQELYTIVSIGFHPFYSGTSIVWSLVLLVAGGYFVLRRKTILPRYYREVLQVLGAFFVLSVGQTLYVIAKLYTNPLEIDPTLTEPEMIKGVVVMSVVSLLFTTLIYYVIYQSVNAVSGIGKEPIKPPAWATTLGWVIIGSMILGVAYYGLSM